MNSEWQSFLEGIGANFEEGAVQDYGDLANELKIAAEGDTLCDLSHEAVVRVTGSDSPDFLQGQLTNDIRQVDAGHHQLSAYCNPKGRVLALFRIFQREGDYHLQLPHELLEATLKRLRMFVLMSKVELEDVSDNLVRFSLCGPNAEALLKAQLGDAPQAPYSAITTDGVTALKVSDKPAQFILHGEPTHLQGLWQALQQQGSQPVGAAAGRGQMIRAGLPEVVAQTTEAFVPQMINLQRINGVSFKKGCYTGQEVVARMQYLGKLKRRMYLAHTQADAPPQPGDEVHAPASASGQGAGKIVNVAPAAEGGYDILAVLEIASADSGELYLNAERKDQLSLKPLPYPLEQDADSPQAAG